MGSVEPVDRTIHREAKIVIIGCGIAGISAALKLYKAGFLNIRILEATGRSGGRIKTGRLGNNVVEIGANWIHGPSEENPVFRLARQYGLLEPEALTAENQAMDVEGHPPWIPSFFTSSGHKLDVEAVVPLEMMFDEILDESSEYLDKDEPFPSVGEFIRSKALEKLKDADEATRSLGLSVVNNMLKVECCVNGTHSLNEVGLSASALYKTLPGLDCTFPNGYDGLIKNLLEELPSDVVTLNCPVRCVQWNNTEKQSPVIVECKNGEKTTADHVIVTVSLGYLKKHRSTMFHPPLPPHKLQSIQRQGFGTNNKIFVEFDSPWWDADCEIIHFLWEDEDAVGDQVPDVQRSWIKKLFGFTVLKPTERYGHVLCGWIAGHESEYMETLSEQEVSQAVTQLIRRFTGNPIVTPKRVLRSQWFHDPWTCGSYSFPGIGCSSQDLNNMMEPLPTKGSQHLTPSASLQNSLNTTGSALSWLKSYLTNHQQIIHINNCSSSTAPWCPRRFGAWSPPVHPLPLSPQKHHSPPWPPLPLPLQVLFAGEATHHCYYSTVHGALLSGWREADRLISHYSSRPSKQFKSKL